MAIINHAEVDLSLRWSQVRWGSEPFSISYHLFALLAILFFLTLEKLPFANYFHKLGAKSYGIYLLHFTIIDMLSKVFYYYAPNLLAYQLILMPLLFAAGFFIPILVMNITINTRLKVIYRYSFG
jgi:peptidoglycan/LPS O-acetylase OafA/YrhL